MKQGRQHRLDGTVAAVDRQKIDLLTGKILQGFQNIIRRLNIAVDHLGLVADETPDIPQAVAITSAERVDDYADARRFAGTPKIAYHLIRVAPQIQLYSFNLG